MIFRSALSLTLLLLISGVLRAQTTIYVSPSGSDTNPGTVSQPLQTISKAMSVAAAGTTIYLRGGVYNISSTLGAAVSGSAGNSINLWAYPGEKPVLDFSGESYSASSRGIEIKRNYWYIKGLDIRNAGDNGIFISGSNNIVENCSVSYCKDTGIQISSGGSNNYIHNCDAFDNNDPATQGQNADGIDVKLAAGPGNVLRGCRVFDNADDGYDCYGTANKVVFDSCWAFHNGYNLWNIQGFTGNGNGFKLGGDDSIGTHIVTNCVSFDNVVKGFDQNNNMGGITVYNCTSFRNGTYNYSFPYAPVSGVDTFKNDISFEAGSADVRIVTGAVQDSNSWQGHTVTAADFLSLDTSLARLPRLADGSLPSTALFRLAPGSLLIDAGTDVGIAYEGNSPDLGAFESGTGPAVLASNGKGGGDWNSASTWAGGVLPDSTSYVVVLSTDSVSVGPSDAANCENLTLLAGGRLADSGPLTVTGTFSLLPNARYYNNNPSVPSFPRAGIYNIDPQSYYIHASGAGSVIGAAGYDSTFGNVIVIRSGTACGVDLTVEGNLTVNTGGSDSVFCATGTSVNRSLNHTVKGDVSVISGAISCVDGASDLMGVWHVEGDVTVGDSSTPPGVACMGPLSGPCDGHRLGVFNIGGSLSFVNGARLQAGSSPKSTSVSETGIINLGGNLSVDSATTFETNSAGIFALNFVGGTTQSVALHAPFVLSSTGMQPVVNDTVYGGSSVTFVSTGKSWLAGGKGSFVVNGTLSMPASDTLKGGQAFYLTDGATFGTAAGSGLDSTGCIQVTGGVYLSRKANFVYNGITPQVTGGWLPDTVNKLTVLNQAGVRLTRSLFVSGTLGVVIGKLLLGANDITVASTTGGSSTRYVATDSTGMLRMPGVGAALSLFPVGTPAGYAPVWVAAPNGGGPIGVSVAQDSGLGGTNVGRVNLKWTVAAAAGGGYTLQLGWPGSEEDSSFAADRSALSRIFAKSDLSYIEAGSGNYTTQSVSAPFTTSRSGIALPGTFVVGNFGVTPVHSGGGAPAVFRLYGNYPNPFNPATTLGFSVARNGYATLKVYNILGQQVATLFSGNAMVGKLYSVRFDAGAFSSGVYFGILESGGQREIHKMVLMK